MLPRGLSRSRSSANAWRTFACRVSIRSSFSDSDMTYTFGNHVSGIRMDTSRVQVQLARKRLL